jgi:hypothetical protein
VPFRLFSVELEFVSVELEFVSVELEFVSVELEFVSVELEFVSVELESKLALTFDMVNENSERIKRKLIERRVKKLY